MEDLKDTLLRLLDQRNDEKTDENAPKTDFSQKTDNESCEGKTAFDIDIGALFGVISAMNSIGEDTRASLLLALKPHLSSERQKRVDNAVKLFKVIPLLPLIKQLFGEG